MAGMPDNKSPGRVLLGHMDGIGTRGRAQTQCLNHIKENLHLAVLSLNCWRTSQDRGGPSAAIDCSLQHT